MEDLYHLASKRRGYDDSIIVQDDTVQFGEGVAVSPVGFEGTEVLWQMIRKPCGYVLQQGLHADITICLLADGLPGETEASRSVSFD